MKKRRISYPDKILLNIDQQISIRISSSVYLHLKFSTNRNQSVGTKSHDLTTKFAGANFRGELEYFVLGSAVYLQFIVPLEKVWHH